MAVKTERFVDPFEGAGQRRAAWRLGMWIFVVVVAMLFAGGIFGYLAVRLNEDVGRNWRPPGAPGLPPILLLSTLLLGVVSAALHDSVASARRDRRQRCARAASIALIAAMCFLLTQGIAWWLLIRRHLDLDSSLYAWTFYVLTGLHALHVIGGVPSLALVAHRARRGRYGPGADDGPVLAAIYWHALGAIWLILYATLWIGSLR